MTTPFAVSSERNRFAPAAQPELCSPPVSYSAGAAASEASALADAAVDRAS
jgi:hypothetical protein